MTSASIIEPLEMTSDITVVVPYHNEMETIEYTLDQVGAQSAPARAAIFVDSTSTDNTFDVVATWIAANQHRFTTQFRNVFEHSDTPASSKNVGIRHAETEWIAFMDCGQRFDTNWLEKQLQFVVAGALDVVSGVVRLSGQNWVDRCAVAQTYGYKRDRPCLPTTLVRKTVFGRTGLLLEGRRAGYDAAWLRKLRGLDIRRGVNAEVRIQYIGINFAPTLRALYRKSVLYAKPTVAIEGHWIPYLYVILPFVALGVAAVCVAAAAVLGLLYFLARTFVIPVTKARNVRFYREHPVEAILGLGLVGLVIDVGKAVGVVQGMDYYYLSKSGPATR